MNQNKEEEKDKQDANESSNSSLSEWEEAEERRDKELMEFVEEFLESEEYQEIIKTRDKQGIIGEVGEIKVPSMEDGDDDEVEEQYPLTKSAQKNRMVEWALEKYLRDKTQKRAMKLNEESIKIIRVQLETNMLLLY